MRRYYCPKWVALAFAVLVFVQLICGSARADTGVVCLLDGRGARTANMLDCATRSVAWGDSANAATGAIGVRINSSVLGVTPIDVFGLCRFVDNSSAQDHFIPFKTPQEWANFLGGLPAGLSVSTCALPFSGSVGDLHYGPSSKRDDMGDTGDDSTTSISLPYWRTGQTWPPAGTDASVNTHPFNHNCYEQSSRAVCWKMVSQSCTGCAATDAKGNCTSSYSYDCSYCADYGSVCDTTWTSWSETYDFIALAGNSELSSPSWTRTSSSRVSGSARPDASCTTRCVSDGHDCTCNNGSTNAACGSANGAKVYGAPSGSALCSSGTASAVSGSGPWTWTCAGAGDGASVTCTTQKTCCIYWGCQ